MGGLASEPGVLATRRYCMGRLQYLRSLRADSAARRRGSFNLGGKPRAGAGIGRARQLAVGGTLALLTLGGCTASMPGVASSNDSPVIETSRDSVPSGAVPRGTVPSAAGPAGTAGHSSLPPTAGTAPTGRCTPGPTGPTAQSRPVLTVSRFSPGIAPWLSKRMSLIVYDDNAVAAAAWSAGERERVGGLDGCQVQRLRQAAKVLSAADLGDPRIEDGGSTQLTSSGGAGWPALDISAEALADGAPVEQLTDQQNQHRAVLASFIDEIERVPREMRSPTVLRAVAGEQPREGATAGIPTVTWPQDQPPQWTGKLAGFDCTGLTGGDAAALLKQLPPPANTDTDTVGTLVRVRGWSNPQQVFVVPVLPGESPCGS